MSALKLSQEQLEQLKKARLTRQHDGALWVSLPGCPEYGVELVDLPPTPAPAPPFSKQPKRRKVDYTSENVERGPNPNRGYKIA